MSLYSWWYFHWHLPLTVPNTCIPTKNRKVQASFAGGFFPFLPAVNYHSQMSSGEATDDRATDGDVCGRILRMFLCAKDPWQYIYMYVCDNHLFNSHHFQTSALFLFGPMSYPKLFWARSSASSLKISQDLVEQLLHVYQKRQADRGDLGNKTGDRTKKRRQLEDGIGFRELIQHISG